MVTGCMFSICLQLHGDTVTSQQDLVTVAKQVQETQTLSWQHLQDSFSQSLVSSFIFKDCSIMIAMFSILAENVNIFVQE